MRMLFWIAWSALLAGKLVLAVVVPLFVDEGFYWLEGRHLAWAYSDLPGLTAWLLRLGEALGGTELWAIRLPFLLLGALVPLLVVRIGRQLGQALCGSGVSRDALGRNDRAANLGWSAGLLALLLPLGGTLGLFALPDVPLVLAGLLCVDAVVGLLASDAAYQRGAALPIAPHGVRLGGARPDANDAPGAGAPKAHPMGGMDAPKAHPMGGTDAPKAHARGGSWLLVGELAVGLVLGGVAHYRFVGTLAAGFAALLLLPAGRALLRDWRVWVAIAAGALAWLPVLLWNGAHGGAGWQFQAVERHPWAFHADGLLFVLVQAAVVTPLLFVAMLVAVAWGLGGLRSQPWAAPTLGLGQAPAQEPWERREPRSDAARYLALFGGLSLLGLFALGFFADRQRISFHWPLTAELALLPLAAVVLCAWATWLRRLAVALAGLGLAVVLALCTALAAPGGTALVPEAKWYPSNFRGWSGLAAGVRQQLDAMPEGTRLAAGDFKIATQLGFALDDDAIAVLPHAFNREHGRDTQLALWGTLAASRSDLGAVPVLLVVDPASVKPRERATYASALCTWAGALPLPRELRVDDGRRRFLLFALGPTTDGGTCPGTGALAGD